MQGNIWCLKITNEITFPGHWTSFNVHTTFIVSSAQSSKSWIIILERQIPFRNQQTVVIISWKIILFETVCLKVCIMYQYMIYFELVALEFHNASVLNYTTGMYQGIVTIPFLTTLHMVKFCVISNYPSLSLQLCTSSIKKKFNDLKWMYYPTTSHFTFQWCH